MSAAGFQSFRRCLLVLLGWVAAAAGAQSVVEFESLDSRAGKPVLLKAFWLPAPAISGPRPAVALFHGCGGPYDRQGQLSRRLRD